MCKSISEGGLRCAAHTRPGYLAAIKPLTLGETLDKGQKALLEVAATAYASTPNGIKQVKEDVTKYARSRKHEIAAILRRATEEGERNYKAAREASVAIEGELLRKEVTTWAANVPPSNTAVNAYLKLLSTELGLTVAEVQAKFSDLQEQHNLGNVEHAAEIDKIRYLMLEGKRVAGTGTEPQTLDLIAEMERLAGDTRRIRRSSVESVESDGTRWVKYGNESVSEIVRSVKYNRETRVAKISLAIKDSEPVEYTYIDVAPSLIRTLVSARSIGAFYAYVFAPLPNGGSLGNKTTRQYSYASHAANNMFPIAESTGPVPRKFLKDFGFSSTNNTVKTKAKPKESITV